MKDLAKPAVPRRLFVLPQHLELRDRYHEEWLSETLRLSAPRRWGIARLALPSDGFARGILRITDIAVRFPSGALGILPPGAPPIQMGVTPQLLAQGPRDVWAGLEDVSEDGPNASVDLGVATRYLQRGGLKAEDRPVLVPRLRLYLEGRDALPEDRVRVVRIRGVGDGIELDPDILPPILWPLEATFLPGAVASVVRALVARQEELFDARRDRPHEPLTFRPEQVPQLMALSVINQAIAALTSATSERGLAPYEVHQAFAELLGAIDAHEGRLDSVPTYDHESPGPGFRILVDRLLQAIPVFARPPHDAFSFTRKDAHTFDLRLPEVALLRRPLYLVVAGAERGTLEQAVPAYAKLGSDTGVERIRQTATRGVDLAPDFDPPASLPSNNRSACFRMNTRSEHWAEVTTRRRLVLYLPNAGPGMSVTLYVLRPSALS